MTTAGLVMMLIVPGVLAIGAGLLLAGDRWSFVPKKVLARSRTPAKVLSYLALDSRLVRGLKFAGRAVLSLWLAAVSAWALGAALNVVGLDGNSQMDTAVLVLFGAVMTAVYFRGLKSQPN